MSIESEYIKYYNNKIEEYTKEYHNALANKCKKISKYYLKEIDTYKEALKLYLDK